MINAAGILLLSKTGRALFLKRGNGGDCPGEWCFPGGRLEEGETTVDAAIRETMEETGNKVVILRDNLIPWTRSTNHRETTGAPPTPPMDAQVDFTTFVQKNVEEFEPDIDASGEHVAFAWAPLNEPPEPLHPGCRVALARFTMNELGIADAMIAGELVSPQRYGGFSLFNIRITGTGISFRARKLGKKATAKDKGAKDENGYLIEREEEYPVRDPALYLTDEFLQRCNGLPVVLEHPAGQRVDGDEFNKRTIGTVFKPYIRNDEVWAIAKIYDEDAIELMTEHQLSTSPGVIWNSETAVGENININGKNFLFEGKPTLMDHIAVCRQGVWDKGGPPIGVETVIARKDAIDMEKTELEAILAENRKSTDTAIATITAGLESLAGSVGKIVARMDSDDKEKEEGRKDRARKDAEEHKFSDRKDEDSDDDYKARHDAEETALCDMYKAAGDSEEDAKEKAAKDRKDAEDEEARVAKDRKDNEDKEEKERKDSATDQTIADLKKQIEELKARSPSVQPKDEDAVGFANAQQRFDDVCTLLGRKTPVPMQGESLLNYRRRGLNTLKDVSKRFKDIELGVVMNDSVGFNIIEDEMLKEIDKIARTDAAVPVGTLREVKKKLPGGHDAVEFLGNAADWMAEFSTGKQFAKLHRHNANGHRAGS